MAQKTGTALDREWHLRFPIDPNQTAQWLNMYSMALERCENNDRQDSYGGSPVTQRSDVSTDLSFYRRK